MFAEQVIESTSKKLEDLLKTIVSICCNLRSDFSVNREILFFDWIKFDASCALNAYPEIDKKYSGFEDFAEDLDCCALSLEKLIERISKHETEEQKAFSPEIILKAHSLLAIVNKQHTATTRFIKAFVKSEQ